MWSFKIFIFLEIIINEFTKETKIIFWCFGPSEDLSTLLRISIHNGESFYIVLYEKPNWEKIWLLFGQFWKPYVFFGIFNYLEIRVTRHERLDRPKNKDRKLFFYLLFFIFFRKRNLKKWYYASDRTDTKRNEENYFLWFLE